MSTFRIKYLRPQILLAFLVVITLLTAGMRVPDLSRPHRTHRPKAAHRTVLEVQQKSGSSEKQLPAFLAIPPGVLVAAATTTSYLLFSAVIPSLYAYSLPATNFGRSPPAPAAI